MEDEKRVVCYGSFFRSKGKVDDTVRSIAMAYYRNRFDGQFPGIKTVTLNKLEYTYYSVHISGTYDIYTREEEMKRVKINLDIPLEVIEYSSKAEAFIMGADTDQSDTGGNSVCRRCGKSFNKKDLIRSHGLESAVVLGGFCSAQCYTAWSMSEDFNADNTD